MISTTTSSFRLSEGQSPSFPVSTPVSNNFESLKTIEETFEENVYEEKVTKSETRTQKMVEQQQTVTEESKLEQTIQEFETQVREMELNQQTTTNQAERNQKFLSNETKFISLS